MIRSCWMFLAGAVLAGLNACDEPTLRPRPAPAQGRVAQAAGEAPRRSGMVDRNRLAAFFDAIMRSAPRPPGSKSLQDLRGYLRSTLEGMGLKVAEEPFPAQTPAGPIPMANLLAEKKGSSGQIVYLATHIDTKLMPAIRFVGANDSGSSTAAVLELAAVVSRLPGRLTYRFAFFDGEEALRRGITSEDGFYGSRHHAAVLARSGQASSVRAFILLDMIGDRDLDIVRDANSSAELYTLFADCCNRIGNSDILSGSSMGVGDDHLAFAELGIPVLDLIDFNYGPSNSYWHTAGDVPEHVSVESIARVTEGVLCMLETFENETAPR